MSVSKAVFVAALSNGAPDLGDLFSIQCPEGLPLPGAGYSILGEAPPRDVDGVPLPTVIVEVMSTPEALDALAAAGDQDPSQAQWLYDAVSEEVPLA